MANQLFVNYLKEIYQRISKGDAREESFYSALEKLMLAYGQSLGKKTDVTVLPKKSEAGQPDFRIWDGESKITGYIEAKPPSTKFLDEIESTEQLKRYLEAYPNILLTNFFEFRLYRHGILWDKPVKISDFSLAKSIPQFPVIQNEDKLRRLLSYFFDFTQPKINSSKTLAEILAYKAMIMRDYVILPIIEENKDNYFSWLYQSFKEHLIRDLKERDFADLFSQTFVYGLVIAKYDFETQQSLFGKKISDLPLTAKTAYDFIQKNFGILREVFKVISTQEMPQKLKVIVDDIVDILNHTEIYKLLIQGHRSGKKDPIFHLYETFLLKYDKERKIKLGVFYTPLEIVSYIVNSVHVLLKDGKLFNTPDGLASYDSQSIDKSITLLDPAVGTGTFFVNAIEKAIEEVKSKYSSSSSYISDFIKNHILPHFFAFEILIAPYVVSHLKVLFSLTEKGFEFKDSDRLRIYLTNTLEFHRKETTGFPGVFEKVLVTEQKNALEVKNKTPILIVIGNPPYSVSSQNQVDLETPFGKFYESYKEKVRKEERNIQPLSDDYIKFLAFAHWKVKQAGKGIVGMITNNSYLDGIIHRDMRKKLLEDFDLIYILNLHGDVKRPKTTKDGGKDENVFDIQQGVGIGIFVKAEKRIEKQVFYQELIGQREDKYKFLDNYNVSDTEWIKLAPKEPYYFFVPKEFGEMENYKKFLQLQEIFTNFSAGVVTSRDKLVIDSSKEKLYLKIHRFMDINYSEDLLREEFNLPDTGTWKLHSAREKVLEKGLQENLFIPYAYRIFDKRYIYYETVLIERSRKEFMENFNNDNLALCTMKRVIDKQWKDIFVTKNFTDYHYIGGQTYSFPLWLYHSEKKTQNQLLPLAQSTPKTSNVKKEVVDLLSSSYKTSVSPEEIFYYIYAVLYSNIYRQKYLEFLKIDFPRIPFTKDYKLFKKLSAFGKQLVEIHLLESELLKNPSSRFEGNNSGLVKKVNYDDKEKRVYINDAQYFTNVESEVWNYFIGGYQVLNKWLKDRKGNYLTDEEIKAYIKIIEALKQTVILQKEIDKYYPQIEQNLITFQL